MRSDSARPALSNNKKNGKRAVAEAEEEENRYLVQLNQDCGQHE